MILILLEIALLKLKYLLEYEGRIPLHVEPTNSNLCHLRVSAFGFVRVPGIIRCKRCGFEGSADLSEFQASHLINNSDCSAVKTHLLEHLLNFGLRCINERGLDPQTWSSCYCRDRAVFVVNSWLEHVKGLPHAELYTEKNKDLLREGLVKHFGDSVTIIKNSNESVYQIRIDNPMVLKITTTELLDLLSNEVGGNTTEMRAVLCNKSWQEWEELLGAANDLLKITENMATSIVVSPPSDRRCF